MRKAYAFAEPWQISPANLMFCFLLVRFLPAHGAGCTGMVRNRRCTVMFTCFAIRYPDRHSSPDRDSVYHGNRQRQFCLV